MGSSGRKMKNFRTILAFFLTFNALADGKLIKIEENNWQDLLTGEWMVEFFAPWCPACRGLQPTWEDFAGWSEDLEIGIGQVDVTSSPGLSGRFMVTALPTIFHVKDGVFRQYRGARDKDSFISFVEDKKWTGVEPISSWKSPDSFQMSLVSYFFKLSMVLRNVHTTLTEDYQMPYWVSYWYAVLTACTHQGEMMIFTTMSSRSPDLTRKIQLLRRMMSKRSLRVVKMKVKRIRIHKMRILVKMREIILRMRVIVRMKPAKTLRGMKARRKRTHVLRTKVAEEGLVKLIKSLSQLTSPVFLKNNLFR